MNRTLHGRSDRTSIPYRDGSGRTLADYPRPSVAVDTALLTLQTSSAEDLTLSVLEVRRQDGRGWGLPGTFLHEGERLINAVHRSLGEKAGVTGLRPRQLHVFDDPDRDDRGWVLSVAHVDVGPIDRLSARNPRETRLAPVESPGRLPYRHDEIIALAVEDLRARYAMTPDPDRLLRASFTLRELRLVHEAVAGHGLQRDTFRRVMIDQLTGTGDAATGSRGRPAELFAHS
jgi:8-oxo-dGTP diphosphatase